MTDYQDFDDDEFVSKSELKREMERLQELGRQLTELTPTQWQSFNLTETLLAALEESKRLKQHEAKRRHLQYIGKLMRSEDVDGIRRQLDLLDPSSELYGRLQRQQELWRTRLVESDDALAEFMAEFPQLDRQHLRNLLRNARKEHASGKPGKHYKALFQFIKAQMAE
jgi:ribosome-associated protein